MSLSTSPQAAPPGTLAAAAAPDAPAVRTAARPRLRVLDGLRFLAALMVVVFHYAGDRVWGDASATFPGLGTVAPYGWLGVQLFFMISGFVICMSAWGKSLGAYVRSRVVRLMPAYWFCVLVTSAVLLLFPVAMTGSESVTPSRILTNLTMLEDPLKVGEIDPSYWTLWVEMRFYLIFAVVAWMGLNYRRVLNFCWVWTIASLLAPSAGIPLLDTLTSAGSAPLFISGIAFYLIRREGPRYTEPWALLALSWLLMQHHMIGTVGVYSPPSGKLSWSVCVAVVTFFYFVMAAVALGWLDRINWKWLPAAGAVSYPLYLIHQQIGVTLFERLKGEVAPWTLLLSVIAAMVFAGWLVQRFVERPGSDLVRRLLAKRPPGA
ncbi:acyltransferase family protein [Streptomyces sp. NPDC012888]|uniref:acyltransferase family protein n=1 Tax=Streptomyces sp. NPDC012888 TaxID=3364855 RepID=UPI0036BF0FD8